MTGAGRARLLVAKVAHRLRRVGPIFFGICALTATLMWAVEHANPRATIKTASDAIWYCVVTMSTVGYGDVVPVTHAGRIIGGCFILFTLATLGILISAISEAVLEVRHMEEAGLIGTRMKGHVIICGFNSMARAALLELLAAERKVALLCERPDEIALVREVRGARSELLFVSSGEPTQELFRERLNALEADAAVIAMPDDAKNLIATLNMKAVNPKVRLVVALQREELRQTLVAGGVTYVASPNELSGRLVASAAFEPEVAQLVEDLMSGATGEFDMQQYQAGPLGGATVAEIRAKLGDLDGPLLIAVAKREGGSYRVVPHPSKDLRVEPDDQIIVMASNEQAERLTERYKIQQGR
jgi:voltage-gated potassium channel